MHALRHLLAIHIIAIAGIIGAICLGLPGTALAASNKISNAPIKITFDSNGGKNIWKQELDDGRTASNTLTRVSRTYDGSITIPRYMDVPTVIGPGTVGEDKNGKTLEDLRFCFVRNNCTSTGYWAFKAYKPGKIKNDSVDKSGNPVVRCVKPGATYSSPRAFRKAAGLKDETSVTLYATWNFATFNVRLDPNGADQKKSVFQSRAVNTLQEIGDVNRPIQAQGASLTRENYVLSSWNTKLDGSGKSYKPGQRVKLSPSEAKVTTNEDYNSDPVQLDSEVVQAPQDYMDYIAANAYDKKTKKGLFSKPFPLAQGGVAFKHGGTVYYCQLFVPSYAPKDKAAQWLRDGNGKSGYKACLSIYNTKTGKTAHTQISTFLGHGNSVDYDDATQRLVVSTVAWGQPVEAGKEKLRLAVPAFREFKVNFNRDGSIRSVKLIGPKSRYPKASDGQDLKQGVKPYRFGKACNRTYTDKAGKTVHAIYDKGRTNSSWVEYRWDKKKKRYVAQKKPLVLKVPAECKHRGLCAQNLNRGYTNSLASMMIQGASVGRDMFYFTGQAGHGSAMVAAYDFSGKLRFTRVISGGENGIREIESISEVGSKWYLFSAYHSEGKVHVLTCPRNIASNVLYAQWKPVKSSKASKKKSSSKLRAQSLSI